MKTVAPYGSWKSPVTPASLVEAAVGLSEAGVDGDRVRWVESRPAEGGRLVLVSAPLGGGDPADDLPAGFSVRTAVHEYGGRCHAATGGHVVFANWGDQRLWLVRPGGAAQPVPVTPEPEQPRARRYADPVAEPGGRWIICVRESHLAGGRVVNDLVAVDLDAARDGRPAEPVVLASGSDFYSFPRLSPDGRRLAWITWEQPAMPWDATTLWLAEVHLGDRPRLGDAVAVAGGPDESVTQPVWSPAGELHYVSDRSGWWNIYDSSGAPVVETPAEFAGPAWVFGNRDYGFDPGGRLVATWSGPAGRRLGVLERGAAGFSELDLGYTSWSYLAPIDGGLVAVAASPTGPPAVVHARWADRSVDVLRRSRPATLDPAWISVPEAVDFPTGEGEVAHALLYRPTSGDFTGPEGERPPLVVTLHGGPTSSAVGVYNPAVQYWTTRGFAVADVDYRGSSGYGRSYRRRLDGAWGLADVEDCAAVVTELDRRELVDGSRAVIRGGSAGGFSVLAALAFTDAFAAGASHYGVADLELLARHTHKFEARYLDGLVGPWPDAADEYRRRSPIHHVEAITSPLILFQGLEDRVVPPQQAELMYRALEEKGVPVAYLAFDGEQHGFRRAETVVAVMTAELTFYGRVLGFEPDVDDPALVVANAGALSPRC